MTDNQTQNTPAQVTAGGLLAAALAYAGRGWGVLPLHTIRDGGCTCGSPACPSAGKHPDGRLARRGIYSAAADPPQLTAWWRRQPAANVGIRTGQASGLVVLDIDRRNGGDATLAAWLRQHGPLPRTAEARTGGGGRHILFAWSARASRSRVLGPGVDLLADGKLMVAPPSRHRSGGRYTWVIPPDPATPLAPLPTWLAALAASPPASGDSLPDPPGPIRAGTRNTTLTSRAATLRRQGQTADDITAALLGENRARCRPPLPDAEVRQIAESVARYPPAPAGTPPNATPDAGAPAAPRPASDLLDWPVPLALAGNALPTFPTDCLPDWLAAFVAAEARATQTPPDLGAMLSLTICALACAKKGLVQLREGWTEPLNLYTVTVLPPGTRKTAVFRDMVAPVEAYEARLTAQAAPAVARAQASRKVGEARLQALQRRAAKAQGPEAATLEAAIRDLAVALATAPTPHQPRLVVDDCTPEQLATLLHEQGGRLAVLSAEGDIFDLMTGRYGAGAANCGVFLRAHAGDSVRVDRVGRPPEYVREPALTLGLAVQPDVLTGIFNKPVLRGRGLLGRILYALPASGVGRRTPAPPPVPPAVRATYAAGVRALLELPPAPSPGGAAGGVLRLEPAARAQLDRFVAWIEPQLDEFGGLGGLPDWAGKLAGAVGRIAGLLHLADHRADPAPWDSRLTSGTMERAIAIGEYLIPHAQAAYAQIGADPHLEGAAHLLRWLARTGGAPFTKRDAFEGTKARFRRVEALEPALALLVQYAYIRRLPEETRAGPGRPKSPRYEVNPRWRAPREPAKPPAATNRADSAHSAHSATDRQAVSH